MRDTNTTLAAAADGTRAGREVNNPVMYAAAGESAPAGTAILRINARAFSDGSWTDPTRATAAESTDYRYSTGLTFELWTTDNNEDNAQKFGPQQKVDEDWASCTTNDQGTCDIVIPQSYLNKRYAVKQVNDAPGAYHMEDFNWGNYGNAKIRHNAPYPGYTVRVQSGKVYSFPLTSDIDDDRRSFGAAAQSLDNPPLEAARTCYPRGPRIALVMDTTLSIEDSGNKNNLRNAVYGPGGFVDNLLGTGAEIASFSFAERSPGPAQRNFPQPLNVDTDADTIKRQIREHNLNNFAGVTSWEQGLAAVYEANKQYHYDEVIFVTDGDPNHWSNRVIGPNVDSSVRAIEAGIYRANLIKDMGTRIVTIGAGWAANPGQTSSSNQLKAVSGPVSGLDYFATDWGGLADSLRYAGNQITCQTDVTAKKVIVDAAGNPVADQSPARDWAIDITASNFAGTVDNGRGENPANLPLAAVSPNNDTDDSANPLVLKDQERTTGDDNSAHWGISYYARELSDAHSDVTLAEKTDSKPGFKFVPGKMVNGQPTGSYYRIIDRSTNQPVGDPVLITSPSQKIRDVRRGQTVEAVFANTPLASFSVEKTAKTPRITAGPDGTFTAEFTVTVANTSQVAGTSPAVNDRPVEDSDFVADTVMVDGRRVEVGDGGTYEVTPGVPLDPGARKTFTVTLKGRTPPGFLENQRPAECTPGNPEGARNGVEMAGDTDGNANNEACVSVEPPRPGALTIVKKINGDDANVAPGVTVEPGADMNVTYEVTNTGGMPVYNVTVADKITTEGDKAVENITADDQAKAAKLDPGQTVTFSAKVKAPATGGTLHTDVAKAHGVATDPKNPNAPGQNAPQVESNEDPANATTKPKDGLRVVKKINGDDANQAPGVTVEPGADMNVTYEVTNTGNRPVFNVTVADKIASEGDKAVRNIVPSDRAKAAKLPAGESVTFTATIKAPAVGGVQHHDVASAHGVSPSPTDPNRPAEPPSPDEPNRPGVPPVTSPEDPGFAHTTPRDGLRVVKKINNDDANAAPGVEVAPGSDLNVTYVVTNTGNRPVFNVNVTDQIVSENNAEVKNIATATPEKAAKLPAGESVTFTATIKAPAVGGVQHHDVASAHGVSPSPTDPNRPAEPPSPDEPNRPGVPPVTSPEDPGFAHTTPRDGLRVVKKINNDDANAAPGVEVAPGSDLNVTYVVTNTGNRPVFNVTVADKIVSEGDKAVENIVTATPEKAKRLNPGESVEFTATIKAPAVGGVQHHDVASAHGVPPSPTDPNRPAEPPSPSEPPSPGNPPSSTVPPSPSEPGKPGEPPSPDEPNKPGVPPVDSPEDPGFAHTTPQDGLKVVKKINGDDANTAPGVEVAPGSDMNITYEVTNTGNRPLFNVTVVDLIATDNNAEVKNITTATPEKAAKLNPGESVTFTATVKAPEGDNKWHADVARAYGVPPSPTDPSKPGDPNDPRTPPVYSPEDPGNAHTPPPAEPPAPPKRGLKVVKKINGDDANVVPGVEVKPGSDMKVTYEVTNTGDQVLNDVRVVDRIVTESDAPVKGITPEKVDSLRPGETVVFTATIKAPQASATVHHDVAKAIGVPPSGGNKPPSGGVTPPPGGQTPPTGGVTPPPGGQTPPTGEVTPPPSGETPPPTGEVTPPPSGQTPPPGGETPPTGEVTPPPGGQTPPPGEGTPPPVESPEDPGFAHTPPPGDKTPPPPVIPIIPIIPIIPPAPSVPPVPPAPNPPAPNAPVPPAPAPQAPTPPAPENNRGGALAKTGVSAGLGYALLAGLVLLAAGAVMFVLGRRRRSEGGDR
ncbi:hypothetical protein QP948_05915 [Corynebacterium bovis]|uniref:DUF7507 domain-containing protein n=1 Tax=Corynebacterium bovis TaxID=36808 RepID=UPI00254A59CF|nr:hypothetical protein [Corynebacterium bovis]MDK8510940.1 hypothetical protein [Corynebacterium bovis]